MTVRAGRTFADGQVSRRLGAVYLMDPRRARPDKRVPHVIPLPEPVHLFGRRGPFVVGVMSDAPLELREMWVMAHAQPRGVAV